MFCTILENWTFIGIIRYLVNFTSLLESNKYIMISSQNIEHIKNVDIDEVIDNKTGLAFVDVLMNLSILCWLNVYR